MSLQQELSSGLAQIGLVLDANQQARLIRYVELLQKWNAVYNLTAIRDPRLIVSGHLLDSLAAVPHLWPERWLDVGCGAGVPGLVLAVAKPKWEFSLLDSSSKKTTFVRQAIIELGLKNARVYCSRVEDWNPGERFDGIISRAYSDLGKFLRSTRHLAGRNGRWVAMKAVPGNELADIPQGCRIDEVIPIQVPGLDAARSLVIASCKESQAA